MVLVDTVFPAALTPLVPYFAEGYGLSKSSLGILSGAFGTGVLLGSAPSGYATARLGVKPAALSGLLLMFIASLLFGFAHAAWELVALRLVAGFGSALSWVSAFTWIVARAPEERRGQMIGTLLSAAVVGALLGPVLGSAASAIGVPLAFALVCVVSLVVAGSASVAPAPGPSLEAKKPFWRALAEVLRPRPATGLLLVGFSPLLFGVLAVLAPLQLARLGWGAAAIGTVFFVAALFEAAVHPLLGRWSDDSGYRPPVLAGLLASFAVLLALPLAAVPLLVAYSYDPRRAGLQHPARPRHCTLLQERREDRYRGRLRLRHYQLRLGLGQRDRGSLGGVLADLAGDALPYLSLAAVCLLALLMTRRLV